MDLSEFDISLIKKHLHGKLTPLEEADFSMRFATDPDFRAEIAFFERMFAVYKDQEHERLKKMLQELEEKEFSTSGKPGKKFFWLAMMMVILALAAWFYHRSLQRTAPEAVFAQYFRPYENTYVVHTRALGSPSEPAWKAYDAGDFSKAAALFKQLPPEEQTPEMHFYEAVSLLASKQPLEALPFLQSLEQSAPPGKYAQAARWYLALCWLDLGKPANARPVLEKISSDQSNYNYYKAIDMLKNIDNQ